MVLPPGLEPGFSAPEADALSIELWEPKLKIKSQGIRWSISIWVKYERRFIFKI